MNKQLQFDLLQYQVAVRYYITRSHYRLDGTILYFNNFNSFIFGIEYIKDENKYRYHSKLGPFKDFDTLQEIYKHLLRYDVE